MPAIRASPSAPASSAILPAFASAVLLALIALLIGFESMVRVFQPVADPLRRGDRHRRGWPRVNLLSAWILGVHGITTITITHEHHHDHDHDHDHNLRAAFFHVMADALTSVLAIVGLLAAWGYGWTWLDPAIGLVGALVIAHWSWRLIRDAGAVLLDAAPDARACDGDPRPPGQGDDRIADLHVWRVGPGHHAAIVSLVSDSPLPVDDYKMRLAGLARLSHVTVEVHRCTHSH